MDRKRKAKILTGMVVGLALIAFGWTAETLFFMDLGAHSTNSEAFEIIKAAAEEGKLSNTRDGGELHDASLWVANDASRAVMSSVRLVRNLTTVFYFAGIVALVLAAVGVLRSTPPTRDQSPKEA